MEKVREYLNADRICILCLVAVPLLIIRYLEVPVVYFNNDDFFLGELVSGITTGRPESHLVHIGYPLGFVLSRLYMLWPSISWYGMFLFGISYISIVYAFSVMLLRLKKTYEKIFFVIISCFILLSFFFYHLVELQYTTVTVIVGMATVVQLISLTEETTVKLFLKKNIMGFVFFAISLCMRDKACIMILPFFFFIGVSKVILNRKMLKPIGGYAICLIIIIILVMGAERIAYSSDDWSRTEKYNTARENLIDYNYYPVYEENIKLYQELGISEQSYISMATRYQILLDENVNADMYVALKEASAKKQSPDVIELIRMFVKRQLQDLTDRPLNIIVYFMYVFAIFMIFLSRKYKVFCDISAIFCARMIIWVCLMYVGRIPPRLSQGVYIVELMAVLAVIVGNELWKGLKKENAKMPMVGGVLVSVAILFICFKWGLPNSQRIYYYNQSQMVYGTCYQEMREYFTEHPDNVYLGDTLSFSYFNKDLFAKEYPSAGNLVIMGSWTANTQWTDYIAERYKIKSYEEAAIMQDNVYFVCMDSEDTPWQYLADYYAEKYPGSVMEVEEVVETTFGRNFFILKVRQG